MATPKNTLLDISKPTHRKHLKPRREPYWKRISAGCQLGVRVGATGESWVAKYRDDDGKRQSKALDGALDYDAADRMARSWFDEVGKGLVGGQTVADASRRYVDQIRIEKGDVQARDAEGRVRRRIYGTKFGKIPLAKLLRAHVEKWRDDLLKVEQKASANRDLNTLKAVLNRALDAQLVESDRAWKTVKAFPGASNPRTRFLSLQERRELLGCATGAIRNLIEACLHTAARPIEIHRATVADFDPFTKTLTLVGYKGKTGNARTRVMPLTPAAAGFFSRMAKSKLPTAPLVPRDDGKFWQHSDHDELFRAVRDKAGLPPSVTLYTVRHSVIAEWLLSGIDPLTVSKIAGTGLPMIERHYSKFVQSRAAEKLAAVEVV